MQEASVSASSRLATKSKRPANVAEIPGPDVRKPPLTPWWTAQARVTSW